MASLPIISDGKTVSTFGRSEAQKFVQDGSDQKHEGPSNSPTSSDDTAHLHTHIARLTKEINELKDADIQRVADELNEDPMRNLDNIANLHMKLKGFAQQEKMMADLLAAMQDVSLWVRTFR